MQISTGFLGVVSLFFLSFFFDGRVNFLMAYVIVEMEILSKFEENGVARLKSQMLFSIYNGC